MIIAIDGPSGSGKSTLGRMLARELNLLYIDTGSMYRAVALATIEAGIDPSDTEAVTTLASSADIDLDGAVRKATTLPNASCITLLVMKMETAEQPKLKTTIRGLLAKRSDERSASIAPTVTAAAPP